MDCERKCNARTCACPATGDRARRFTPTELAYIEAERKGVRMDSLCDACPDPERCVRRGLDCASGPA